MCLVLMVIAFAALVAITLLFWRNSPTVKDSFEKRTFWKSFWAHRPLKQEILDREAAIAAEMQEKELAKLR